MRRVRLGDTKSSQIRFSKGTMRRAGCTPRDPCAILGTCLSPANSIP
jgi:hypothetical protein